jgi:hypothetical protein
MLIPPVEMRTDIWEQTHTATMNELSLRNGELMRLESK